MIVPKICGIETEYGIITSGLGISAASASALLVGAYLAADGEPAIWDLARESPGTDARGYTLPGWSHQHGETLHAGGVLTNGARYYVDHAHPEYCTPECVGPLQVVLHDRAGEEIVRRSIELASSVLGPEATIVVNKNNSDGKGNSYGCHENYLVDREVPFGLLASAMSTHFVTRQILSGAGKVGVENGSPDDPVDFQIGQRADFFEEEIGLETTMRRPIINTRDEPHCDPSKYRRLHVIVGDANMSQVATLVKVGSTSLLLGALEAGLLPAELVLRHPVREIRAVSRDCTLRHEVELREGSRRSALECQWRLLEVAEKHAANCDLDPLGGDTPLVLREWRRLLEGLASDPSSVADSIDWLAKRRLVDGYAARHRLDASDARLKLIDIQYSDLRAGKSLAARCGLRELVSAGDVQTAVTMPPSETRAYFRGECLRRWPDAVVTAGWDGIVLDTGDGELRRIPMPEPARGTKGLLGELIAASASPADLVERLQRGDDGHHAVGEVLDHLPERLLEPGW